MKFNLLNENKLFFKKYNNSNSNSYFFKYTSLYWRELVDYYCGPQQVYEFGDRNLLFSQTTKNTNVYLELNLGLRLYYVSKK